MKRTLSVWLALMLVVSLSFAQVRKTERFTEDWKFNLGDTPAAKDASFDDSKWRTLNLPHDWSIEGQFSEKNPATPGGGALPGGTGWYRKTFSIPATAADKIVYIDFDGVYRNSEVWINGHYLGIRPFGYSSFRYELTQYLNFGDKPNVLAVRVDNSQQPNSRWYSGSGIYRNVWLVTTNKTHVSQWGTYITTPQVSNEKALVNLELKVRCTTRPTNVSISTKLLDATNTEVAISVAANIDLKDSLTTINQQLTINNPSLWSIERPTMYKALTSITENGKIVDEYETPFAIRYFEFNAEKGFSLNGKSLKILGVCNHHDLGCLGAAINVSALHRQLRIMKEMGVNGIRTSHNPPAPELLNLCDSMGFIVMDEAFDMWRKRKSPFDYSHDFNAWHERDLTDLVLRDRNHPSVFMWSIGNEILEQWNDIKADTLDMKQANLLLNFAKKIDTAALKEKTNVNSMIAAKLASMVKKLDPSRPVTSANNEPGKWNNIFKSGAMDIIGFNYHEANIPDVPKNFPGKAFIGTENVSALMTRGYYRMPSDSMYIWPKRWDIPFSDSTFSCSSYDNCHAPWGSTHEECWRYIKKTDFVSGLYIWTGFDYLGEPTPYWWPARSSYFGIVDLAGFPKDVYYMYQSEWNSKPVLHVFPHWNHKLGEMVDIWAYYNNADEVELFLNKVSMGVKRKNAEEFHVSWRLAYAPGTVEVVSRKNGKVILTKEIRTAEAPAKIELVADKSVVNADGEDLSFVTIKITDKNGILVPNAENLVKFEVSGEGKIEAVDNGSPISAESFKASERKAFYGLCLAVVRPTKKAGKITITAKSQGLGDASLTIESK